jgi:hypothetical protein
LPGSASTRTPRRSVVTCTGRWLGAQNSSTTGTHPSGDAWALGHAEDRRAERRLPRSPNGSCGRTPERPAGVTLLCGGKSAGLMPGGRAQLPCCFR